MFYPRVMGVDVLEPATAPALSAINSIGGLSGSYTYAVSFVSGYGETMVGPLSATVVTSGSVELSGIPIHPTNSIQQRKLYRTVNGGTSLYLVDTIDDNRTTRYTDLLPDIDLGAPAPASNFASTIGSIEGSVQFTRQVLRSASTITAGGTTLDDATPVLKTEFAFVVVPVAGQGIRLPPINANLVGLKITVFNDDFANSLEIYPRIATDSIDGAPAGTPYTLAAGFSAEFISTDATSWRFASSLTSGVAGPPSGGAGGDLTGNFPNPSLADNGAVAGTYGDSSNVPVIDLDSTGRITTLTTTPVNRSPNGAAGGDLTGTYPSPTIAPTGITAAVYGSGAFVPEITVDITGRLTNVVPRAVVVNNVGGVTTNAFGTRLMISGNTTAVGADNTAVGVDAGQGLTSGTANTLYGASAGSSLSSGSNNIVLGSGAQASSSAQDNEITIGNASHIRVRFASASVIPVFLNNTAALTGLLTPGCLYRTGEDPDLLCIVHA